jgi:hypothetical protein
VKHIDEEIPAGLREAIRAGRVDLANGNGRRVPWGLIVTVVIALIGWLLAGAGDYRRITERVTTLEVQRVEDKNRLERMDDKLDRILERVK